MVEAIKPTLTEQLTYWPRALFLLARNGKPEGFKSLRRVIFLIALRRCRLHWLRIDPTAT